MHLIVSHSLRILKWIFIATCVGLLSGSASAFFLFSLDKATSWRIENPWLLYCLPLAGFIMTSLYKRSGTELHKGNNLILEQIHNPQSKIPLRLWPLVWGATLLTHLCGGSAGREGTAVQMAGALSDQFTSWLRLSAEERKILLMTGMAAGFASVFGTPWAGALFGIEVLALGRIQYRGLFPCLLSAFIAHAVCLIWGIHHTQYNISIIPSFSFQSILISLAAGAIFGLCAGFFSRSHHFIAERVKSLISCASLRVVIGGFLIITLTLLLQSDKFLGLGLEVISSSFLQPSSPFDFFWKIIFTIVTLGFGFKGGEVTPLFFIGATLGSALSVFTPFSCGFLAALGFVSVFAGAANTPLACILMAAELFGADVGFYAALAIVASYLFSGNHGIYRSQKIEMGKYA